MDGVKKTIWFTDVEYPEVVGTILNLGDALRKVELHREQGKANLWVAGKEQLEPFMRFTNKKTGGKSDRTLRVKIKVDGDPDGLTKVHGSLLSEFAEGATTISYEQGSFLTVRFKAAGEKKAFVDFVRNNHFCDCRVLD